MQLGLFLILMRENVLNGLMWHYQPEQVWPDELIDISSVLQKSFTRMYYRCQFKLFSAIACEITNFSNMPANALHCIVLFIVLLNIL